MEVLIPNLKPLLSICVSLHAHSRLTGNDEYPTLKPVSNNGRINTENDIGIMAADLSDMFFHAALKNVFKLRF
jgi:hypothetical protein